MLEKVPATQSLQTVSALLLHAVVSRVPAAQWLHVRHWPLLRYDAAGQLVHCVAVPLQLAQLESQAAQTRSALAVHAAASYCPVGQPTEQVAQAPLLK